MQRYQENDVGKDIEIVIMEDGAAKDISTSTTRTIYIRDTTTGAVKPFVATMPNGGVDGLISYTPIAGDLSPPGRWSIQARIVGPGYDYGTDVGQFEIAPNLY